MRCKAVRSWVVTLAVGAVALAACGSDESTTTTSAGTHIHCGVDGGAGDGRHRDHARDERRHDDGRPDGLQLDQADVTAAGVALVPQIRSRRA